MFLFRFSRAQKVLRRALQAAVASHRPALVRELLERHGACAFGLALRELRDCPPQVAADALSMLDSGARQKLRLPLRSPHSSARVGARPDVRAESLVRAPRGLPHALLVWGQQ